MDAESYSRKNVKTKSYDFKFNPQFADYISGKYNIPKLTNNIVQLTKSEMCSVILKKTDPHGYIHYMTTHTTNPEISLCQDHPLYTKAIETKTIIISNNLTKDP